MALAALQVHIEDLERREVPETQVVIEPEVDRDERIVVPSFRLKHVLPATFVARSKDKENHKLVAAEYEKVCQLTDRDAKHQYLHTCQLVAVHECDYFPVKQVRFGEGGGKREEEKWRWCS